jgi:DNA-binding response OmpR family regulator
MYAVVVDDDAQTLHNIAKWLPDCKFTRIEALLNSRELALLLADVKAGTRPEPALFLLDMMIGADSQAGLKMLKHVRGVLPHAPVVIMSHSNLRELIHLSFKLGAVSYIHKSFRPEAFRKRIAEMFFYFSEVSEVPLEGE